MVASDFDVSRRVRGRAATEQDIFARRFQEIVDDLVCAGDSGFGIVSTGDGLGIGTSASPRYAFEVIEVRVHDCDVIRVAEHHTVCNFVSRGPVQPHTVENDIGAVPHVEEETDDASTDGPRYLEPNEPIMVTRNENTAVARRDQDLSEAAGRCWSSGRAVVGWAIWQ